MSQGSHPNPPQPFLPRSCSLSTCISLINGDGDRLQMGSDPTAGTVLQGWRPGIEAVLHPGEEHPHTRPPSTLLPCSTLPACPIPGSAVHVACHSLPGISR